MSSTTPGEPHDPIDSGLDIGTFGIVPMWVIEELADNPRAFHVWVVLSAHANRTSACWPSRARIAQLCSCDIRTVSRALAELEQRGLVETEPRFHNNRQVASRYLLHMVKRRGDTDVTPGGHERHPRGGHGCPTEQDHSEQEPLATLEAREIDEIAPSEFQENRSIVEHGGSPKSGIQQLIETNVNAVGPPLSMGLLEQHAMASVELGTKRDLIFEALAEVCSIDYREVSKAERGRLNAACKELRHLGATPGEIHRRAENYQARWGGRRLTPSALVGRWAESGALCLDEGARPAPTTANGARATVGERAAFFDERARQAELEAVHDRRVREHIVDTAPSQAAALRALGSYELRSID